MPEFQKILISSAKNTRVRRAWQGRVVIDGSLTAVAATAALTLSVVLQKIPAFQNTSLAIQLPLLMLTLIAATLGLRNMLAKYGRRKNAFPSSPFGAAVEDGHTALSHRMDRTIHYASASLCWAPD